jgi:aerobic-type carbon monoxide dehydrogenase small subunit (CoxS/CutS family)
MDNKISFRINGEERTAEVDPEMKVIDLIRDVLGLTGTKRGCDNSTCGACTVILNGKAVKSCGLPVLKADGADIITVEGLAKGTELHPVQKALAESGAIQCGFCTPGIVMELVALYDENPEASETEIVNALNKHLCRCTGYEAIREGALLARKLVARPAEKAA